MQKQNTQLVSGHTPDAPFVELNEPLLKSHKRKIRNMANPRVSMF